MRATRAPAALICLLAAAALAIGGCGGGDDSSTGTVVDVGESRPAPPKSDFPSAQGKSLAEVLESADGPSELVVSPAARVFYKGENRYPFGVFQRDRAQVPDAKVALYFAKVPSRKGESGKFSAAVTDPKTAAQALDQP
ncbi:MAG TPA: hypothetical protein VFT10_04295, partial [Solirubrobacterales bacterium]|nr:hypothetical protein [Solirubrobacterales bacterium]